MFGAVCRRLCIPHGLLPIIISAIHDYSPQGQPTVLAAGAGIRLIIALIAVILHTPVTLSAALLVSLVRLVMTCTILLQTLLLLALFLFLFLFLC